MFLTDAEKAMRDGAEGPAVAAAMDLLLRYGAALDASRLCDIRNVAGTMTQPSPVKARLVKEHGWDKAFAVINLDSDGDFEVPPMAVPTCQLQHGFGADALGIVPYPKENIELQASGEAFYGRHGVNILATCTPYQVGNLPMRGEHCAWMESSAVIYANSVLGARTNCEGIASTGAASLTGKIPCWGNHLDANRYGTHLVDVRVRVDNFQDWGMLGYFAGGVAGEDHPVITGSIGQPDLTELKHFGAAAATSGGVELYHIPGITPEMPTVEAAFGGGRAAVACRLRAGGAAGDVRDPQRDRHVRGRGLRAARLPARLGRPDPERRGRARRQAAVPVDGAVDHGAARAQGRRGPQRVHRGDRAGRRPGARRLLPGDVAGRAEAGPGCSPPTRPSRRTTCPRSSASRPGSARSRSASTPPLPDVGTED